MALVYRPSLVVSSLMPKKARLAMLLPSMTSKRIVVFLHCIITHSALYHKTVPSGGFLRKKERKPPTWLTAFPLTPRCGSRLPGRRWLRPQPAAPSSGGIGPGWATASVPSIWNTAGQSPAHWVQPMHRSGSTYAFIEKPPSDNALRAVWPIRLRIMPMQRAQDVVHKNSGGYRP